MNKKEIPLNKVKINSWVLISRIEDEMLRVRLGVFIQEREQFVLVKRAIGKNGAICLQIQETTIGIRSSDAKQIWVKPIEKDWL